MVRTELLNYVREKDLKSQEKFSKTYLEQAYDIITLLANQIRKIPLDKFKYKPISFDMKRLVI